MIETGVLGGIGPRPAMPGGATGHSPTTTTDLFGRMLTDAIGALADLQANADAKAQALATGENVDLHDVMIAQEQSSLAFQFGLQVRNKIVEAYQDVMRMTL